MTGETATKAARRVWGRDTRIDHRRRTADALTHLLLRAVSPMLADDPHAREDAARAIMDVLMQEGIMVLSEHDRQDLGLPPRDGKGWTADEIRAYEARLLMLMTAPPTIPAMPIK